MLGMMQGYYYARKKYLKKGNKKWIHRLMVFLNLIHGCHVSEKADIGENTQLGYGGIGIVIHDNCVIGKNCIISQNVTIGGHEFHEGVPVLGDYVKVGAGACILGGVKIGSHSIVGANAVVLKDVPEYTIVAGVPAREIRKVKS